MLGGWHFDVATGEWIFYDPRPVFASANESVNLVLGRSYCVVVPNGARKLRERITPITPDQRMGIPTV